MASASEPLVVLRYVGGVAGGERPHYGWGWTSDPRNELALPSFAEWLQAWSTILARIDFTSRGCPVAQMKSMDGFDQLQAEHAPVIAIAADASALLILSAILKATLGNKLTDEALSAGAQTVRDGVIDGLPADARAAPHLNDVTASGFYASCIRFVAKWSARGCDVILLD